MAKTRKHTDVVVGAFYQRTENPLDVVYSVGGSNTRIYGYNGHGETFEAKPEEVMQWTMLAVNDFPNSKDPRLAYVFDLHWDVKRVSELRSVDDEDKNEMAVLLTQTYGVDNPFSNFKKLATAVRLYNDIENEYIAAPLIPNNDSGPSL